MAPDRLRPFSAASPWDGAPLGVGALVLTLVLVAGCSGGSPMETSEPTPTTRTDALMTTVTTTGPLPSTPSGETEVTAVTMPVPPRKDYGMYEDAIVAGGRTHRGSIEYANFLASCYAEFGIPARVLGPGHLEVHATEEQSSIANQTHLECEQRAVNDGLIADPMYFPSERLELWYRAYVEVAYECLVTNGFPTTAPPSMDVWVEEYPDTWHPHGSRLPDEAFEACPQDPVLLLIELGERDEADSGS
jgi:hypothetical protein